MSTYIPELAQKFCELVADGHTIRSACRKMVKPSKATVFRWLREYPEFVKLYELATDERAEAMADEMVEIADNCKTDADSIRKARLRIDAREKQLQLMKPKKYGKQLQLTGAGGGPIQHKTVTALTDDELLAIAGRQQESTDATDA